MIELRASRAACVGRGLGAAPPTARAASVHYKYFGAGGPVTNAGRSRRRRTAD